MSATPTWAARVEAYLAYRRSLGFELSIEGGQLGSFARFADQRGAERLTLELSTDEDLLSALLRFMQLRGHRQHLAARA